MSVNAAEAFASESGTTVTEVRDVSSTTVTSTPLPQFEDLSPKYTEEDLAKARSQEKDKLYPQIDHLKEKLSLLEKDREERIHQEEAARKGAEDEARRKAEAEMDVRTLLETKEREWQEQLDAERQEREKAFALLDMERTFQELQVYRAERIEEERDAIIPELIDLIAGSTPDEIEQSIAGLRDRSSRILDSAQQAMQSARKEMTGSRVTAPSAGPLDTNSENQQFTAEQIAGMPYNEYVKHRSKLLGQASAQRNRGLFG
jgi:hypothetical protein